jgi:hypothetical protein
MTSRVLPGRWVLWELSGVLSVLVERWEEQWRGVLVMRKVAGSNPAGGSGHSALTVKSRAPHGSRRGISPARRRIADRPGRVLSGGEFGFAGLRVAIKTEMASGMGQE